MDIVLASARSDLRFALEVLLREQPGLTVVGTTTGTEGLLSLMEATCPDMVLFDWDLPGRPPSHVLAAARNLEHPPYLIVLGRDEDTEQAALEAGVDAFVLRGELPDQLPQVLEQARSAEMTATA